LLLQSFFRLAKELYDELLCQNTYNLYKRVRGKLSHHGHFLVSFLTE